MHWRRKWQPTPVFLPGESQGQGTWWAAVYGVLQSQTGVKRLSSSSSSTHFVPYLQALTMSPDCMIPWIPEGGETGPLRQEPIVFSLLPA